MQRGIVLTLGIIACTVSCAEEAAPPPEVARPVKIFEVGGGGAEVRRDFPEKFAERAQQSRQLGCRLTRVQGKRIFLDELEPEVDLFAPQAESVSCGPDCGDA